MKSDTNETATSPAMRWTGRILSALPILMMVAGAVSAVIKPSMMQEGMAKYGYPPGVGHVILIVEMICVLLYAIPQTAVLGAILLTGYLGGATATHVRIGETKFIAPVIIGMIVWFGLFLRDARLRALIPLRR